MRRCLIPSLLTCIAFACGYPTYVGGDGVPSFDAGYVPNYNDGGPEAGDGGSAEAEADACVSDAGTPPDFSPDKGCAVAPNCAAIIHHVDCCDNSVIVGVASSKLTEAQALEMTWRATLAQNCKSCGACVAGPTVTEDGDAGRLPDAGVQLECAGLPPNGLCRSKRP